MGYVVVADMASVRDPDDGAQRREDIRHLFVSRGQTLPDGVSDGEIERLVAQGAIAKESSQEAKLATAGMPRSSSLRSNPSAIPLLGNEAEAIRAAQSAAQFPGGMAGPGAEQSAEELAKLPMDSLVVFAKAFAIPVDENATKASLAKLIVSGGKDAEAAEDRETLRTERDQRQLESRETDPRSGVVPSKFGGKSGGKSGGGKLGGSGGGKSGAEQSGGGQSGGGGGDQSGGTSSGGTTGGAEQGSPRGSTPSSPS